MSRIPPFSSRPGQVRPAARVVQALLRSLATLAQPGVWPLLLGPALLALVTWGALAFFLLDGLMAILLEQPPLGWLLAWGFAWLAKLLAVFGGWLLILAAAYLTAVMLAAIFVLPLLLNRLAAVDYPDLARMGQDSVVASTWNTLSAALLFAAGWLLTWPLWLIPGLGLFLPIYWLAWLNRRTFAFDALAVHASEAEWRELRRQHATPLLMLGALLALLAHVPLLGLLTPALAALAYIHFVLAALRDLRQGAILTVVEYRNVKEDRP